MTQDQAGNVFISDSINDLVRMVAAKTGTFGGQAVTAGDIYTVAGGGRTYGEGLPARQVRLQFPGGLAIDSHGNLAISDSADERARVLATSTGTFYGIAMTAGHIYTVAGEPIGLAGVCCDGGPATHAQMLLPESATVDAAGNLLVADQIGHRVRVVAARSGTFYGQQMAAGDIYTVAGGGTDTSDGVPATQARMEPVDVRPDLAGNLLIADLLNSKVRVVAASTGEFYGQAMTAGDIYTVAGAGGRGFSGDGGPATSALLFQPSAVALDGHGNLLIADTGNDRIRAVAASTGTFYGQAMTKGDIYTIVSGADSPVGVAVDGAGNVVDAQAFTPRVDVLAEKTGTFYGIAMTAGHTYDVAGDGTAGFSGDGGPGPSAELNIPGQVAIDPSGNLVLADVGNHRIRVVATKAGTFYGVAMTAGNIYTVVGNGQAGFTGDGHRATGAELDNANGIGFNAAGDLLVADSDNSRIRMITP
jgi:hypothetical protein